MLRSATRHCLMLTKFKDHCRQLPAIAISCQILEVLQHNMWVVFLSISLQFQVSNGFTIDDNTPAIYWSVVECDIAIICACMPSLPSLLKNLFPSIFGPPSNKYYSNISPPPQVQSSDGSIPLDRIKIDASWQVTSSQTNLVCGPGTPRK